MSVKKILGTYQRIAPEQQRGTAGRAGPAHLTSDDVQAIFSQKNVGRYYSEDERTKGAKRILDDIQAGRVTADEDAARAVLGWTTRRTDGIGARIVGGGNAVNDLTNAGLSVANATGAVLLATGMGSIGLPIMMVASPIIVGRFAHAALRD